MTIEAAKTATATRTSAVRPGPEVRRPEAYRRMSGKKGGFLENQYTPRI